MLRRSNLFLKTGCTRTCLILGSIGILCSLAAARAISHSTHEGLQHAIALNKTLQSVKPINSTEAIESRLVQEKAAVDRHAKRLGALIFSTGAIATSAIVLISRKAILKEVDLTEKMLSLASTDSLTGIPNRRGWTESIERFESLANRHELGIGIAIIDLNGFKELNDTQGHEAGDRELCHIADVLVHACRREDVVARLGGDEFGILLIAVTQHTKNTIEQNIRAKLKKEQINFALGLHIINQGESFKEGWKQADLAMYLDKRSRSNKSLSPPGSSTPEYWGEHT